MSIGNSAQSNMLIAFEGIDGSGKTTLARKFADMKEFLFTKEPTFSSEEADELNIKHSNKADSEIEFLFDRVNHQKLIKKSEDIVCDRYLWTGMAYCRVFNSEMYSFIRKVYTHSFFRRPDCYVFIDTPPKICSQRGKIQDLPTLEKIRKAYEITKVNIEPQSKVIYIDGSNGWVECMHDIFRGLGKFWPRLSEKVVQMSLL